MKRLWLVILLLLLTCVKISAQPDTQYVHNYEFTFGLDPSLWVDLTDAHNINPLTKTSELEDFGFSFYFFDHAYRSLTINSQGSIHFTTRFPDEYSEIVTPFPSSFNQAYRWKFHVPYIMPFGMSLYQGYGSYSRWGVVGSPGHRKVVCDFALAYTPEYPGIYKCQVQLAEEDGSVLYLYKHVQDTFTAYGNVGMALNPTHFVTINSNTYYASDVPNTTTHDDPNLATIWPAGDYKYYRLKPKFKICANPARLIPENVGQTTADIRWRHNPSDAYYIYEYDNYLTYDETWEYDAVGKPLRTTRIHGSHTTADTVLHLRNLQPGKAYEIRMATVCRNGDTSSTQRLHFFTYDSKEANNKFDYANIYGAHAKPFNGTYADPCRYDEIFDHGALDSTSRHTVCHTANERDSMTNDGLLRIFPRSCYSVKLGDTLKGSLTEGITYTVDVDTLNYDLLLVHFAIVEQSPNHDQPPMITIDFLDSAGNLSDSCYHVNFLSNSLGDDWHPGNSHSTSESPMWKSWSTVGLDLTPFHGQRIQIRITNADCGQGAHYGYCYYSIESGIKNMRSNACSDATNTTFRAPEGFVYRWYSPTDPSTTLSTADSLSVTQPGWYHCWVGFRHNPTCGFELKNYAGPRIPVPVFHAEPLDSCGHRYRFVNESYLAQDENLTPFPGLRPESYLWRFDDGTTSTEVNPIHEFTEGRHTVELVALEGNGECRDSITDVVVMAPDSNIIYDSMCVGGKYPFHDTLITTAGTYVYYEGCLRHVLHLYLYEPFVEGHDDTVCRGEGIWVRDRYFEDDEYQSFAIPGPYSCDSTYWVDLTIREWPEPDIDIDQTCRGEAFYTATLTPGWKYTWRSEPRDAGIRFLEGETSVRLTPSVTTQYFVGFSYPNAPYCTVTDTFTLTPVNYVTAAIAVSPDYLDMDRTSFVATDVSRGNTQRIWFVDDEQQASTDEEITYEMDMNNPPDSVRLMIVASNPSCQDTAYRVVTVYRHQLFFPNIFTPGQELNGVFRPVGFGVTDYELYIYDRRGMQVFQSTDMAEAWDGTCNGQTCPQGAYAYICRYTIPTGERKQQLGTVTLIR